MIFAIAILLAVSTSTVHDTVQLLAMMHIGFRVVYHILYLLNIGVWCSVAWAIAIGCSFTIMGLCLDY
ncbi:MAPEG family protein [Vibrio sp. Isolate23]|uniref:MAPEG family protein n=1 Tax=Vibrio sp. Isolate23 TaxID=2908533 RepID=UPI001EFD5936|nr:MAPEG family protein [Vibrio sp. Isolate23]MCG9681800.1 MAPEG family protein [Vibrio sp. Isolate23]